MGVSTKPKEIDLKAAEFMTASNTMAFLTLSPSVRKLTKLNKDVRERYSKHVSPVFQVGDKLSDDYKRQLNYPAELIPQQNPYALKVGDTITVLCTVEDQPAKHQFVMAGWESRDGKLHTFETRADSDGFARVKLARAGKWYIKFIHVAPLSDPNLNYESKWASLTFEIRNRKRSS